MTTADTLPVCVRCHNFCTCLWAVKWILLLDYSAIYSAALADAIPVLTVALLIRCCALPSVVQSVTLQQKAWGGCLSSWQPCNMVSLLLKKYYCEWKTFHVLLSLLEFKRNIKMTIVFFNLMSLPHAHTHKHVYLFCFVFCLCFLEGLSLLQLLVALILYSVWTLFYSVIQMSLKFSLKFSLKLHSSSFHKVLFFWPSS